MVAHWTLCVVFPSNFINEITRTINKHCNDDDNDEREYIYPMKFVTVMTAQIFPHAASPTWIHHFSEYSLVCRHVNLTVSFARCFREPVQLAPPYAKILCLMTRPRSQSQVQSEDEKRKRTKPRVGYLKLLRQATDIIVFLFQEASVTDIRCLSRRKSTRRKSAVWAALQVMQKVTSLLHYKRQLKSPHITFKKCDQMNRFYAVLKMSLHTEHCV